MAPKTEYDRLIASIKRSRKQIARLEEQLPSEQQNLFSLDRRLETLGFETSQSKDDVNRFEDEFYRIKLDLRDIKRQHKPELAAAKNAARHQRRVNRDRRAREKVLKEEARWAAFPSKPNKQLIDLSSNEKIFDFLRENGTTSLEEIWEDLIHSTTTPTFELCQQVMDEVFTLMRLIQQRIVSRPGTKIMFNKVEREEDLMLKMSVLRDPATGYETRFNIFIGDEFETGIHNHSRSFFSHVIHGSYEHSLYDEHKAQHCDHCTKTSLFHRGWVNGSKTSVDTKETRYVCRDPSRSHLRQKGHLMFLESDLLHTVSSRFDESRNSISSVSEYNGVTLVLLLPKCKSVSNFYVVDGNETSFSNERLMKTVKGDTWAAVHDLCQVVCERDSGYQVDFGCPE